MTLGTRIAVLEKGELQQTGTPLDVFARPANIFVARFVGSPAMNVIASSLVRGLRLSASASSDASGATLTGVRPHDVSLVSPDSSDVDLRGTVDLVEHLGASQLVHVAIDNRAGESARERVRVVVSGDTVVRREEVVGLHVRRDRLHHFDERTGKRLADPGGRIEP